MAGPISELITTTIEHRSGDLADNVSDNNALLKRLKERGNRKTIGGGRVIRQELSYAENATYKRYSGYEPLDVQPSDVMTSAEYDWKQVAVSVTVSGLEELQNAGKEQIIPLVASRIEVAETTLMNGMSVDIYSAGTADGGRQVGGLQVLVPDDPTAGTAGGISRVTYSWWRNALYDFSVETVTPGPTTIQSAMNTLYLRASRGADQPDLIVADNTYFQYYWNSLQAIQRIQSETGRTKAGAGFLSLVYANADVIFDGGQGGACPSAHMYFLNSKYLQFVSHKKRNFVPLDPKRFSINQDASVTLIGWAGNMIMSNGSLQGVMIA